MVFCYQRIAFVPKGVFVSSSNSCPRDIWKLDRICLYTWTQHKMDQYPNNLFKSYRNEMKRNC